jgi:Spy/CpxP family protein refolding chaperone
LNQAEGRTVETHDQAGKTNPVYEKGAVMLRKKKLWAFIPVLIAALMFLGGCHRRSPEKMADHIVDELTAKLKLTAAQQGQLNAIKVELLGKVAEMRKSREGMHDEVMAELQKDTLDQERLKKMVATHRGEMDEMANLLIDRLAKFHATLTAEQKAELVEFMKEKEKYRKHCFFDR